jgi:Uma2 family endonuclease
MVKNSAISIPVFRWTRAKYEQLVDSGVLTESDRVELLDGELVTMTPQGTLHATAINLVSETLRNTIGPNHLIRVQQPFALDNASEPEPDIAVVPGTARDYMHRHPNTAMLIVEVSDRTLAYDSGRKKDRYARNRIQDYWIVNLADRHLEVYRCIKNDCYVDRLILTVGDRITPLAFPSASIPIQALLP